jgi:hypothetical protein
MAETKGFFTRDFGSTVIYPTRLGDSIQLKGLTSGSVNLIVPSVVGGDYTLTLPSIIGTVALVGHTQTISTISDATTVGQNLVKLTNPSAITFPRINADNSVSTLAASTFLTAIGGAAVAQTMYIGTTSVAINRGSGTLNLAGIGTLGVGAITTTGVLTLPNSNTLTGSTLNGYSYVGFNNGIVTGGSQDGGSSNVIGSAFTQSLNTSSGNGLTQTGVLINPAFHTNLSFANAAYGLNIAPSLTGTYFITNAYGLYVSATTIGSGTITNNYAAGFGGDIITTGSITTGTPTGGTAGAWKLGIRVAATVLFNTTQYIQLDVGGTLYKLALAT